MIFRDRLWVMRLWTLLEGRKPSPLENLLRVDLKTRWWEMPVVVLILFTFVMILGFSFTPPLMLFFAGLLVGMIPAVGVSNALNSVHRRGFYEFLCLLPEGRLSIDTRFASFFVRYNRLLNLIRRLSLIAQLFLFMYVGVTIAGYAYSTLLSTLPFRRDFSIDLIWLGYILLFAVLFRAEYLYSMVIGILTGIVTPRRVEGAALAASAFLLIHTLTYLVYGLITVELLSRLTGAASLLVSVILLVVYIALREMTVYQLWRLIIHQLNTDMDELAHIERNEVFGA